MQINAKQRAVVVCWIAALMATVTYLPIRLYVESDGICIFKFKFIWTLFGGYKPVSAQIQHNFIAIEILVATLVGAGVAFLLRDEK